MTDQNKVNTEANSDKSLEEDNRLRKLYTFLLGKTDLGIGGNKPSKSKKPNESLISAQWGMTNYKLFIRKVLRAVYGSDVYSDPEDRMPGISLYRLVEILVSLDNYRSSIKDEKECTRKISRSDKIKAIRLYSQLSLSEKNDLDIPTGAKEELIDQLIKKLYEPNLDISEKSLQELYKFTLAKSLKDSSDKVKLELDNSNNSISGKTKDKIRRIVSRSVLNYYQENNSSKLIDEFTNKTFRELERLLFQSGLEQMSRKVAPSIPTNQITEEEINSQIEKSISDEKIAGISLSLVENGTLTKDFPIYIKWIDVQRVKPLPLRVYDSRNKSDGLLNPDLMKNINSGLMENMNSKELIALEKQVAYSVEVHFRFRENSETNVSQSFSEKVTGIGSALSLANAAINKFLLWDIEVLRDRGIYPIAKEIFINNELIGDDGNGVVFSHAISQLCQQEELRNLMGNGRKASSSHFENEPNSANYCSFDIIESVSQCRLVSIVGAIFNLGINPDKYLKDLKRKVSEINTHREGLSYIKSHPFSLWAMKGFLENNLLEYIRKNPETGDIKPANERQRWTLVAYNAHMDIIEYFLIEGDCKRANEYMESICESADANNPDCIFTELMFARYYYLQAYLCYLKYEEHKFTWIANVESLISEALYYLQKRLEICNVLGGLSQNNIYPFFGLQAKIYSLKARLYLYFPRYIQDPSLKPPGNLKLVLTLLEMSRICAARDGNPGKYAGYSAFQSCIYAMLSRSKKILELLNLESNKCLKWSDRLLKHSALCYEEIGENAYLKVKSNLGSTNGKYGNEKVNIIPSPLIIESDFKLEENAIKEMNKLDKDNKDNLLINDEKDNISGAKKSDPTDVKKIYIPYFSDVFTFRKNEMEDKIHLFGAESSSILLAKGINKLVNIENDINDKNNFYDNLKKAIRYLIAAWAMSKDGGKSFPTKDGKHDIKPIYHKAVFDDDGISRIRSLCFHRTNQVISSSWHAILLCKILEVIYLKVINKEIVSLENLKDSLEEFNKEFDQKDVCNTTARHQSIYKYYKAQINDIENENFLDKDKNRISSLGAEKYCLNRRDEMIENVLNITVG
jgi:hypothetical protein